MDKPFSPFSQLIFGKAKYSIYHIDLLSHIHFWLDWISLAKVKAEKPFGCAKIPDFGLHPCFMVLSVVYSQESPCNLYIDFSFFFVIHCIPFLQRD